MKTTDDKSKESDDNKSENLINKNVSPNEDATRSWDDTNQLDRGNDKEKLAGSGGAGTYRENDK